MVLPTGRIRVDIAPGGDPTDDSTWNWVDITNPYVRFASGITIGYGRADEFSEVSPSSCELTLDNRDGRFSPRNPLGPYYGELDRNTPLRVRWKVDSDDFGTSVTGGWGSSDSGNAWTRFGISGVQDDTDWAVSAGEGIHRVETTSCARANYLSTLRLLDCEAAVTVRLGISDVTGGNVEPAGILLRVQDSTTYYMARLNVTTSETITVSVHRVTTAGDLQLAVSSTVLETLADQPLRVRAQAIGPFIRAKVWPAAGTEPAAWDVTGEDFEIDTPGGVGIRSGVGAGNSNAKPVEFFYDDFEILVGRFSGFVTEWPPKWDLSGRNAYVPIKAAGILRRLQQGAKPLQSTLRRRLPSFNPAAYWPLEDGKGTTDAGSPISRVTAMKVRAMEFESTTDLAGSGPLPQTGPGSNWLGVVPSWNATQWHVEWVMRMDDTPSFTNQIMMITTAGTVRTWRVATDAGNVYLTGNDADGVQLFSQNTTNPDFLGNWLRVQLYATQNGGNIDWVIRWIAIGGSQAWQFSNSVAGDIGRVMTVSLPPRGSSATPFYLGHVGVFKTANITAYNNADHGFNDEWAITRFERVSNEEDIPTVSLAPEWESTLLGPQPVGTMLNVVRAAETADQGLLFELGGRLAYAGKINRENQPPRLVLDVAAGEVAAAPEPTDDDQQLRNDVTVSRTGGSSARAVDDASVAKVGTYDGDSFEANVLGDDQLPDLAGWRVHLGTVDEMRWPQVSLNLARNPHLIDDWLSTRLGNRLRMVHAIEQLPGVDVDLLVDGWTEYLDPRMWRAELNCVPASPWDVAVMYGVGPPALAARNERAVAASTTSLTVRLPRDPDGNPGWRVGQLAFLFVNVNSNTATLTPPAGWNALDSSPVTTGTMRLWLGWKILASGEPDPAMGISPAAKASGSIVTYDGHDPVGPIAAVGTRGTRGGVVATVVAGSVTTTDNAQRIVGFFAEKSNSSTTASYPANMELRSFQFAGSPNEASVLVLDELITTAGATGTRTVTYDVSSDSGYGILVAIRSAPAGPSRLDTDGSELHTAVGSGDTTLLVTTTADDAPVWTEDAAEFPLDVKLGGEAVRVTAIAPALNDTFTRSVASGWGTSDSGEVWTTEGGSASDFSTTGTRGRHQHNALATRHYTFTTSTYADVDLQSELICGVAATGGSIAMGLMARVVDSGNHYLCQCLFGTGGTLQLAIFEKVTGSYTQLGSTFSGWRYSAGSTVRMRFRVVGDRLQAKLWTSESEPPGWNLDLTDTTFTAAGKVGAHTNLTSGVTNALPVNLDHDNLRITTPQRFTVQRSINGIAKAQAAGTDVRLAKPAPLAL